MKTVGFSLLISLASIFTFSCNTKPTETEPVETKVCGKVLDKETNAIISGAQVTTTPTTSSVITDESGSYTISDVTPGKYTVGASKSGYKPSTISVTVVEGKTASADMLLESIKAELALSSTAIDFGSDQTVASVVLTNGTGVSSVNWTGACSVNWLTLSQASGTVSTASNTVTLSVNRAGLSYGNYSTVVTITSNGGNKDISVTMTVANPNAPQLTVNPIVLEMGATLSQMTFNIHNSGTGKLYWTAATMTGWITLSPQSDSTASEIDNVKVTVNRSDLSPGNYSGDISVLSNAGSQTVNVKITVPAVPSLSLSSTSIDFDSSKTQLSFNVSNAGTGTLTWYTAGNQSWMTVQPPGGTNGGTVNITVNRAGLAPGNYTGAVSLTSNGGGGNVAVAMRVPFPTPPAPVTATAGPVTTSSVQLNWTEYTGNDFAAYKVYYSTSPAVNENSSLAATVTSKSATSYTITGLASNTTYYFRVFILSQTQQTAGSNTASGKTERTFPMWQQVALPVNFQIQSVHYIAENNIWAAGYTTISGYNFPRIYQFNGSQWIQSSVQGQDSLGAISAIAFLNNSEGWAASGSYRKIYKFNGTEWKVARYLNNSDSYSLYEGVGTATDVWFYGQKNSYPLIMRWNGTEFTELVPSSIYNHSVDDMHFYNSTAGFAADNGYNGYMFNGVGWINLGLITSNSGYSITLSGTSKNDVWASEGKYLYRYDGISWKRQNDIGGAGISYPFGQIRMISSSEGWATAGTSVYNSATGNSEYPVYYYNGSSWNKAGVVSGQLDEIKDFGNGNLWGIISGSPNQLMRLQ